MTRLFGIAGVQMSVVPWNANATIDKMSDVAVNIRNSFPWVQMIVYPELAVPGTVPFLTPENKEWWRKTSETIPGPLTERLCFLARKIERWLIPGSMYELDGDKIYNTAIVISPKGEIVAKCRKMFPWLPYESGTTSGAEFCVFDIPDAGRFGLLIAYDAWFPETSRTLAWMGAETIIQLSLTPTSDRELELVMARANAMFNQAYFVNVNGIGPWGGGRSIIVNPDGNVVQESSTNQTVLTEILDFDHVTRTREFGNLGLCQTLKQLRDSGQKFPVYQDEGGLPEGSFNNLGALKFFHNLNIPNYDNGKENEVKLK